MGPRRVVGSLEERFAAGDESVLSEVLDQYAGPTMAVAANLLGDRRLAEEAAQQAFVQAWRAASSFDPSRPLGPWLRSIVRRTAVDIWRRERRHQTRNIDEVAPLDLPTVDPPSLDDVDDVWRLRQAIDALPPASREVVQLAHLEQLTQPEIAERLGIPLGTVKSRTHSAYRQLAAALRTDPASGPYLRT
jgi:RNA polymerase sigma factor (sigma-70 family)